MYIKMIMKSLAISSIIPDTDKKSRNDGIIKNRLSKENLIGFFIGIFYDIKITLTKEMPKDILVDK
jgi:hypothetical protein